MSNMTMFTQLCRTVLSTFASAAVGMLTAVTSLPLDNLVVTDKTCLFGQE